jgi:C-terminal processing protease CtpA/Prc
MPLSGDRAIKLTTSLYYTPSGVSINHRGIAPDIELAREPDESSAQAPAAADPALPLEQRDPDVKRAIQELKIPTVGGPGSVTAALPPRGP